MRCFGGGGECLRMGEKKAPKDGDGVGYPRHD